MRQLMTKNMGTIEQIEYEGFIYWYEYKLARDRVDICLATTNPKQFCNGVYLYSAKDPGNGMAFVVIETNDPELPSLHGTRNS